MKAPLDSVVRHEQAHLRAEMEGVVRPHRVIADCHKRYKLHT